MQVVPHLWRHRLPAPQGRQGVKLTSLQVVAVLPSGASVLAANGAFMRPLAFLVRATLLIPLNTFLGSHRQVVDLRLHGRGPFGLRVNLLDFAAAFASTTLGLCRGRITPRVLTRLRKLVQKLVEQRVVKLSATATTTR